MTNVEKLVQVDQEIRALTAEIKRAERLYVHPLLSDLDAAGQRANELWLKVLEEHGPGAAQDALRAAKGEA